MGEETSQAQTLFVGGLPQDATMEEVKAYFQQFGEVDVDIKFDQQTGRSRGFGFLAYQDPASVQPCLDNAANHQIRDKWVDVKIYSKGGGKGGKGKGKDGGKGFGAPKGGMKGGGYGGGGGYQGYGKGAPAQQYGGYEQTPQYSGEQTVTSQYAGYGAGGGYAQQPYGGYAQQPAYQQQSYGGYGQQQMRYSPY
jgi:hypothetical protein